MSAHASNMNTLTEPVLAATPFEIVISGSGLEADRQIEIRDAFAPFANRANEWAEKIATVTDPKIARETRLAMRRERIDLEKKHAEFKARTLSWTRAVDGSRKVISDAYDTMECQMDAIEKAEANRIAAEKAAKKAERDAALRQYGVDVTWIQTGEMTDAQFLGLLNQSRDAYEKKLADAKAAEEARIAKEKADAEARAEQVRKDAEAREAQRKENERLKAEADVRERWLAAESKRVADEKAAADAFAKAERDAIEAHAKKERDAAAAKAAEEKKKADAKLKAEQAEHAKRLAEMQAEAKKLRDEKARVDAEVQAKVDAEKKRAADEAEAKRRAEAAPDAEKLRAFSSSLDSLVWPSCVTEAGQEYLRRAKMEMIELQRHVEEDADKLEGGK